MKRKIPTRHQLIVKVLQGSWIIFDESHIQKGLHISACCLAKALLDCGCDGHIDYSL